MLSDVSAEQYTGRLKFVSAERRTISVEICTEPDLNNSIIYFKILFESIILLDP